MLRISLLQVKAFGIPVSSTVAEFTALLAAACSVLGYVYQVVNGADASFGQLEARVAKLEAGQEKLEAGQEKLEAGQEKLLTGQQKLEASISQQFAALADSLTRKRMERGEDALLLRGVSDLPRTDGLS